MHHHSNAILTKFDLAHFESFLCQVSMSYMRQIIFLFIGGLIVAVAIEEWNLHRRVALRILMLMGSKPCW